MAAEKTMVSEDEFAEEGLSDAPERIAILGEPGVGKSTFASGAPRLFSFDLERSTLKIQHIKRNRKPIETFEAFLAGLDWIRNARHDYQSFSIDTCDKLESLIHRHLCEKEKVDSIEQVGKGFGRGYTFSLEKHREVWSRIDDIARNRAMHPIVVSHYRLSTVKNPSGYDYHRHDFKTHEKVAALTFENVDHVLYATRNVVVTRDAFDENRARAIGGESRILRTVGSPTHVAKSRARLPDPIPLSWHDFVCHLARAGFPRLLRETVVDNARRLGDPEIARKTAGAMRDNPDLATLAGMNARLCEMLAKTAPGVVAQAEASAQASNGAASAPAAESEVPRN
jgi:hypothetical protein